RHLLGTEPILSRNGRLSFFNMADFTQRLREGYTDEAWQKEHDLVCYAPQLLWRRGFYAEEATAQDRWHWCGQEGTLEILNLSDSPKQVSLRFLARTCQPGPATLNIHS